MEQVLTVYILYITRTDHSLHLFCYSFWEISDVQKGPAKDWKQPGT